MQPPRSKGKEGTKVQHGIYPRRGSPLPASEDPNDACVSLTRDMQRATLNSLASEHVRRTSESGPSPLFHHDDRTVVVSSSDEDEYFSDGQRDSYDGAAYKRWKAYVVYKGRIPGVYTEWEACSAQVLGYFHNSYKGFRSLEDAQHAWNKSLARRKVSRPFTPPPATAMASQTPLRQPAYTPRPSASAARLANITAGLQMRQEVPSPSSATRVSKARLPGATAPTSPTVESADSALRQTTPHVGSVTFLGEESLWCVVIEGRYPGVYHGRSAVTRAIGHPTAGLVQIAASESEANRSFVNAFMSRKVVRFE
ncbi:hypothetical protein H0H92_015831 [Tricholoma furcatifolium]|nr:hypothetical protein H0H92_015831 [Tricholoma furcatifolium]